MQHKILLNATSLQTCCNEIDFRKLLSKMFMMTAIIFIQLQKKEKIQSIDFYALNCNYLKLLYFSKLNVAL